MKIIFFGLGSIGKRHARLIQKYFPEHQLFAFRSQKKTEKNELGLPEIYQLRDLDKIKPQIAFITNPTSEHLKYACYCANKKIHLFIEKPLSNQKKDLPLFVNLVRKKGVTIYLAYCLRFHPVIKWLKGYLLEHTPLHVNVYSSSYLPEWRKNRNHLQGYSAQKSRGGGVILDLSHEIDYLYYLFGKMQEIKVNSKKISDITLDAEDFADILIKFDRKPEIFANVHLNFLSRLKKRELILDFKEETMTADLLSATITSISEGKKIIHPFKFDLDQMYLTQLQYFFNNLGNKEIMNGVDESLKIFDEILKVKRAAGS